MPHDPRHISHGCVIPTSSYSDQPYIVKTDDGAWLLTVTTGAGHEGEPGQHVTSMRSTDCGKTWSTPVPLEPPEGVEASYAVMLKTPRGRIYCFYNHNTDNLREVLMEDGRTTTRVDTLGNYVFKYSDDHGRTWSAKRYVVPVRAFDCDRANVYGGKIRFFWNVGRPLICGDTALLTLHKVGNFGPGFLHRTEGVFLRSDNILRENDPEKIRWETLPRGDVGLRTPPGGGLVAEEHSITQLSDGTIMCVYRTLDGHPVHAFSSDMGETWTAPAYMTFGPGRRRVKNPRAANFIWRCANGKYLYWFHNHGGKFVRDMGSAWNGYDHRNPAWLCGGVEVDTPEGRRIDWSEPEIALYDDDPWVRMSYPDLVEDGGVYYVTETQKNLARTHALPAPLLEGMWAQFDTPRDAAATAEELPLDLAGDVPREIAMPPLPVFARSDWSRPDLGRFDERSGITIDFSLTLDGPQPGRVLLDTMTPDGRGFRVSVDSDASVAIEFGDRQTTQRWRSDRGVLSAGGRHHVAIVLDGGPKIVMFIVDGVFNDGGDERQFGWGRFSPNLATVTGAATLRVMPDGGGTIHRLRLYTRTLRTAEVVGNHRVASRAPAQGR